MPREAHEDGGDHEAEIQTRTRPHSQSKQSKHRRKQHSSHRGAAGAVVEDEGEEARPTVGDRRNQMRLPSNLCPHPCNKQRIEVEEADVAVRGVAEQEAAQSGFHSAWQLVAVNSVDS